MNSLLFTSNASDTYGWMALAFGILGIIGSFFLVGLVTEPLGIILGIIEIKRADEIGLAIFGIVFAISLVVGICSETPIPDETPDPPVELVYTTGPASSNFAPQIVQNF